MPRAQRVGWFLLVFVLPSLFSVGRLGGYPGIAAYVLAAPLLFLLSERYLFPALAALDKRRVALLAAAGFLLLVLLFSVAYPLANAGVVGGGSDRDDALNLAASRLVRGEYPYSARTYLDNPISPLPGSVLLSLPFVLLGTSAYQNLFWLAIFFLVVGRSTGNWGAALGVCAGALAFAPVILNEIVNGSDLFANGIFVFIFTWLLLRPGQTAGSRLVAAVLLGLGLSSRATFWLLLPLLFAYLLRTVGRKQALASMAAAAGSFLLVTLPVYFANPGDFSPLHTAGRLEELGLGSPFTWLIPLLSLLAAILLGLTAHQRAQGSLYLKITLAMAFPLLLGLAVVLIQHGLIYWRLATYGSGYLAFGAYAVLAPAFDAGDGAALAAAGTGDHPVQGGHEAQQVPE